MRSCHVCRAKAVVDLLDLGQQPICNRFLADLESEEYTHPMLIGQCNACGLVQISNPVAANDLLPPYDWITYNEPEAHLDQLAEIIAHLPGLTSESAIWGVSFKDDSLLKRMERFGFRRIYRLDPASDLGIGGRGAGAETIQDHITPERLAALTTARGKPHAVIARHIVEHGHNLRNFLDALLSVVAPQGYVVIEAPDCQVALDLHDYTTIWEEHTIYFTPETFRLIFPYMGLGMVYFQVFPYAFENSLVGIGQSGQTVAAPLIDQDILQGEKSRISAFAQGLAEQRRKFKEFFSEYRQHRGKIALFGAGHLACAFINFLDLKEHILFVADDNPYKQGLYMPGSRLPIRPSQVLLEENVKLCLFSLSPEVEDKVIEKNRLFIELGGQFASIFPASKRALRV